MDERTGGLAAPESGGSPGSPGSSAGTAGTSGRDLRTRLFFTACGAAVAVNLLVAVVILAKVADWCDVRACGGDAFQDNAGAVLFGATVIGVWTGICAGILAVVLPDRWAWSPGVAPVAAAAGMVVGYRTLAPWWLEVSVTGRRNWEPQNLILFPFPELGVAAAVFTAVWLARRGRPRRTGR